MLGQIETSRQEVKPNQVITFHLARPIKWGEIGIYTTAIYGGGAGGAYLVRKYRLGELPAGDHAITWDGRNELGEKVARGVYIAVLTIESEEQYGVKLPHAPASGYGCVENLILQGWDLPQAAKKCGFYEEIPEEVRGSTQMMTCIENFIRITPGLSFNRALESCVVVSQIVEPLITPTQTVTPTLEEEELLKYLTELARKEEEAKKAAIPGWAWMLIAAGALFLLTRK